MVSALMAYSFGPVWAGATRIRVAMTGTLESWGRAALGDCGGLRIPLYVLGAVD